MKKKWWLSVPSLHIVSLAVILLVLALVYRGQNSPAQTLQETVHAALAEVSPTVVMIVGEDAVLGGGVFVSEDGIIMTSKHLVQMGNRYGVRYGGNQIAWARVVSLHPTLDLALLRLEELQAIQSIKIHPSSVLELGDFVLAFGVAPESPSFVSHFGMLSEMDQSVRTGTTTISWLLLTDIPFQAGYSGGPLVNLAGELIGIHTAFGGEHRLGWSTPVDQDMVRTWIAETR